MTKSKTLTNLANLKSRTYPEIDIGLGLLSNDHENVLRSRYEYGYSNDQIAASMHISISTVKRYLSAATKDLEEILKKPYINALVNTPSSEMLIGFSQLIDSLIELLSDQEIVSIEGIGGIGKTSLAQKLVRHPLIVRQFDDLVWINVRQSEVLTGGSGEVNELLLREENIVDAMLAQIEDSTASSPKERFLFLQEKLKSNSYLIVIDNLESYHGCLVPLLTKLKGRTKFLVTSRVVIDRSINRTVASCSIPDLSQHASLALMRHVADNTSVTQIKSATDAHLCQIYEIVGGNPLALKLVVAQSRFFSIEEVVSDLIEVKTSNINELYTFIYWKIWNEMDTNMRATLMSMPMFSKASLEVL